MDNIKEEVSEIKTFDETNPLNRESAFNPPNPKKKGFGYFGLISMGLAALLLLFIFNGKEKPKDGLQKEAIEFEPALKRPVVLPESLPQAIQKLPSSEDQREAALKLARLKSAIVVYGGSGTSGAAQASSNSQADPSESGNANTRFQQDLDKSSPLSVKAASLGPLNQTILQGKMIDGVLETAINSDLPGMVRAMVSHDVYAESGDTVLIPRGSRLVGQYNSEITKGQSRIFVVWTRVIRPDGIEVALNSGGTDPLGKAGIGGSVNRHFWQIFGSSTLLSIIGATTANAGVNATDQYNSASIYRQQLAQGFQNTSANMLQGYINIPPTIQVKQGTRISVFVAHDLDFAEALGTNSKNLVMLP